MNKMQKVIATMSKMDNAWMYRMGIDETFRATRVGTREGLKEIYGNSYTVQSVRRLIGLRRNESKQDIKSKI